MDPGQTRDVPFHGAGAALTAAADLVLPGACAGCSRPGPAVCGACRDLLAQLALPTLGRVSPDPEPPDWPGCTGTLRYEGVAARLTRAFKDEDRRDLGGVLGRLLADAVLRALLAGAPEGQARLEPTLLVPVPSSPAAVRRRGDRPMLLLARRAARVLGPSVSVDEALRVRRGTADQAGLDRAARLANLSGAMRVRGGDRVHGRHVVLVDDVLTSGATLTEGRRALLAGGARRVDLAVVMVTPRRSSGRGLPFAPCPD